MSRRLSREIAIQSLYQQDVHPEADLQMIRELEKKVQGDDLDFYRFLVQGVKEHHPQIDPILERYVKEGWKLSRLSAVDRAVLRVATLELLYQPETPSGAVLNEAVELSKAFSGMETSRFINGILGKLAKDLDQLREELQK
ncbi:transcription antitermination factor NusB [Thermoactinomyces sp. DSM 45892]|uniref:transcription antitermination factor NusB n=1 Tax=Thermoactinomyces sp. DSM 45892 TaxID=1882753 RepID=UPI000898EFC5|nr:transcription antitermination factor NusB [Thermoactinomyces sp. DSM 45892]SDZ03360.1 NusB antitermination factor [Thermoactinomyces sp. DSM 45892]